jgi:pimeloyl-ACP methyl ester carboxylesterase
MRRERAGSSTDSLRPARHRAARRGDRPAPSGHTAPLCTSPGPSAECLWLPRVPARGGHTDGVDIERGVYGSLPYAAIGSGSPLVVLAGLMPVTGVAGDATVRSIVHPLLPLAGSRRLVVLNRRAGLPLGMTMAELAGEHADALSDAFAAPVDLLGTSTGGSIAAQLSADHGDLIRRLVLISAACRLGPAGRTLQARVGELIRRGRYRRAAATAAAGLVPPHRGKFAAAAAGWLLAGRLVHSPEDWADMATTIEAEDGFDLAACAKPITVPTLIVAGRDDRFYSPALFEETAQLVAGSRLHLINGRGHITVTRDRRFIATLAAFLT